MNRNGASRQCELKQTKRDTVTATAGNGFVTINIGIPNEEQMYFLKIFPNPCQKKRFKKGPDTEK